MARFIGTAASFFRPIITQAAYSGAASAVGLGSVYAAGHTALKTYKGGKKVASAYGEFKIDPNVQTAWKVGTSLVGVIGTERVLAALFRYGLKLIYRAALADRRIGQEMVDDMKSRVPQDIPRLIHGITVEYDGDLVVVSAEAIDPYSGEDYAAFVEFGTSEGGKVADSAFFADGTDAGTVFHRKSSGGTKHHATPAEPFFWPAAREGLKKHQELLAEAADGSSEGF